MMSILQRRLERAEARLGSESFVVQSLRDQIAVAEKGKSAREIYITGGVNRPKKTTPDGP